MFQLSLTIFINADVGIYVLHLAILCRIYNVRNNIFLHVTPGDSEVTPGNFYVLDPPGFIQGSQANPVLNVQLCLSKMLLIVRFLGIGNKKNKKKIENYADVWDQIFILTKSTRRHRFWGLGLQKNIESERRGECDFLVILFILQKYMTVQCGCSFY